MRTDLLRFNGAVERDPAIDAWMKEHAGELGAIAHRWFEVMRKCGDEVRELLHDGYPVVCLGDAPFGYVNVFTSHVNVGFFHGAALPDPARLLQGTGKFMRHVKQAETGNGHKCRSAKQAHRYGVLGYKGACRKRLATCYCVSFRSIGRSLERREAPPLDHALQAAGNEAFSVLCRLSA